VGRFWRGFLLSAAIVGPFFVFLYLISNPKIPSTAIVLGCLGLAFSVFCGVLQWIIYDVLLRLWPSRPPSGFDATTYDPADLIGLEAVAPDGTVLGAVKSIREVEGREVLEIRTVGGQNWLMPHTRETVLDIDFQDNRVVIARPSEASEKNA
jgi:hypothetical protein